MKIGTKSNVLIIFNFETKINKYIQWCLRLKSVPQTIPSMDTIANPKWPLLRFDSPRIIRYSFTRIQGVGMTALPIPWLVMGEVSILIDTYQYWKVSMISIATFFWYWYLLIDRYLGFSVYWKNCEFSCEKRKIFL